MEKELKKIIGQLNKAKEMQIKRLEKEVEERAKRFEYALKLIKKYKGKKRFTDKELKEIQSVTCFEHLAFCCKKPCPFRNTALHILGIEPKEFEEEKERIVEDWLIKKLRNLRG